MGSNGENPRRFTSVGVPGGLGGLAWSPDGRSIAYVNYGASLRASVIEVRPLGGGEPAVVVALPRIVSLCWAADGRLLFSTREAPPDQDSGSLWDVRLDPKTFRAADAPKRLAKWAGQLPAAISISADGTRIAVVKARIHSDIYSAELEPGGEKLGSVQRLTLDDRINWPSGWTADSSAILFDADRNGDFDLFRQGLTDRTSQPLLLESGDARGVRLSPDGRWYLYLAWPAPRDGVRSGSVRLMRIPVSGGPAELVFETRGLNGTVFSFGGFDGEGKGPSPVPDFRCPPAGTSPCVVTEAEDKRVVFTAFDLARGRLKEVARIDAAPGAVAWDLSPDGSQIAIAWSADGRLFRQTRNVTDGREWDIPVKGWTGLYSFVWSADGKSLFAASNTLKAGALLKIDLDGRVRVLRRVDNGALAFNNVRPSPDGRRLAFGQATVDANIWLLERAKAR